MDKSEKTSTQVYKRCPDCQQTLSLDRFFKNKSRGDGLSAYCKTCHQKQMSAYRRTPKGREWFRIFNASPKSKERQRRYHCGLRGRETAKRWLQTPSGVMYKYRHRATAHVREREREYYKKRKRERSNYRMEHYYKIQDDANCHSTVNNWYPAYRLSKALETAEVVEIKV